MDKDLRSIKGVSPVIAVILLVAITVVMAAILMIVAQDIATVQETVMPMGVNSAGGNITKWALHITVATHVGDNTTRLVLTKTGTPVSNYSRDISEIRLAPSETDREWEMLNLKGYVWYDNNEDGALGQGDTLIISKPKGGVGTYHLLVTRTGGNLISADLTI